jgi:hypothetical protein
LQHPVCIARGEAMLDAQPTIGDWVHRIRAEYLEMPGLSLTPIEIQRMWGLDPAMCDELLETLVNVGFLRRMRRGGFVRADNASVGRVLTDGHRKTRQR